VPNFFLKQFVEFAKADSFLLVKVFFLKEKLDCSA